MIERLRAEGAEGVWLVSINSWAAAAALDGYAPLVDGPVFQDGEGDPVHVLLGGASYGLWVVDREGHVRFAHPKVSVPGDDEPIVEAELRSVL